MMRYSEARYVPHAPWPLSSSISCASSRCGSQAERNLRSPLPRCCSAGAPSRSRRLSSFAQASLKATHTAGDGEGLALPALPGTVPAEKKMSHGPPSPYSLLGNPVPKWGQLPLLPHSHDPVLEDPVQEVGSWKVVIHTLGWSHMNEETRAYVKNVPGLSGLSLIHI